MGSEKLTVAHVTTVHQRNDTRIRLKEAATHLTSLDANVELFVQDGQGDESTGDGLRIVDTGPRPAGGRISRMTRGAWRMYRALARARVDIVHFHDPELIPVAFLLRLRGVRVVYDVHEDLPRQILSKGYIPTPLRGPLSRIAGLAEWLGGKMFTGIAPATPAIAEHFPADRSVLVQNFPLQNELVAPASTLYSGRPAHFVYVGGISKIRGTIEMVKALERVENTDIRLRMLGKFNSQPLQQETQNLDGWKRVAFEGWADRQAVAATLGQVRAGLVLFLPEPNHVSAQPNKLFEYMSAGLPVIASDFPLWRQIVDGAGCGVLVDPNDPSAIAGAMDWILANPEEAEAMGQRGQRAVNETYNWDREAQKLVEFYRDRLSVPMKPVRT